MLAKLSKGLQLLCSNPKHFIARLGQIVALDLTRKRLRSLTLENNATLWVNYDTVLFPYHPAVQDEQEVLYHAFFREWFQETMRLFGPHVKPGQTVIDVGANMGFTTLVLARLVGGEGKVHSFEPGASMFSRLQELVRQNKLEQVELHQVGCGSRQEKLMLKIPISSGNASLRLPEDMSAEIKKTEMVSIETLDEHLGNQLSQLHFIKIDTEGFEIDVLRGAARTIERLRPIVCIELSAEYRESSAASIEWLLSRNYKFLVAPDLNQCRNGDNFIAIPL